MFMVIQTEIVMELVEIVIQLTMGEQCAHQWGKSNQLSLCEN